jgi:predicted PurR-regulated permease PerM
MTLVPAWLARLGAVGWRLLAVVGLALVLGRVAIELSSVTAGVLVALIVGAALTPTVLGLRARGVSPTLAAAIACLAGLAILAAAVALIFIALFPHVREVADAVREGIGDVREQLEAIGVPAFIGEAFDRFVAGLSTLSLATVVGPVISIVTVLILAGFLTFFLLSDGEKGWAWVVRPLEPRQAEILTASARDGLDRVAGYLRRTTVMAVIDALVALAVLLAFGVPLAGPLVVIVFLGGFVPYLGAIITTIVVVLATLALSGPMAAAAVLLALIAASLIATRLLAGTSIGSRADIHPVFVLAAIPAGAALFGVLGLVALLPVTVFAFAIGRAIVTALGLEPASGIVSRPPPGVPRWLDRLAQWSWRLLVVSVVLAVLVAGIVTVPLVAVAAVLALVIAATLSSPMERLLHLGWRPGLAAFTATTGASILMVAGLVGSVVLAVGPLREILETALDGAEETALTPIIALVAGFGSELVIDVLGFVRSLVAVTLVLLLATLLAFYFLRDGSAWWRRSVARLPSPQREHVDAVGTQAVGVLGGYMVGTAVISLFGAVTSALIMVVLGLPLGLPIGLFTFFASFIPYIGSAASTGLATLVALAVGDTLVVVVMLIFTVVFNLVQGSYITPIVYGRTMRLHPAVILLAIPAGAEVAGILGMFLVVPFVAIVASTWRTLIAIAGGTVPASEAAAELTVAPETA